MLDTAIVAQAAQFSGYLNAGKLIGLRGNASPTDQPTADVFPTRDGYIQITALRQHQVEALFAVLGETEALSRPEFADVKARVANPDLVKACMAMVGATSWSRSSVDRARESAPTPT